MGSSLLDYNGLYRDYYKDPFHRVIKASIGLYRDNGCTLHSLSRIGFAVLV